jgi:hypothetical protein
VFRIRIRMNLQMIRLLDPVRMKNADPEAAACKFVMRGSKAFLAQIITKKDTERGIWHTLLNMWGLDRAGCRSGCSLSIFLKNINYFSMIWIRIRIEIFFPLNPDPQKNSAGSKQWLYVSTIVLALWDECIDQPLCSFLFVIIVTKIFFCRL